MRKPDFCICENKDADQLRGNREADQRLCFRYTDSTIPLLPKSKISSLWPSSVAVQPGLCGTWSETPKTGFLTTRLILECSRLHLASVAGPTSLCLIWLDTRKEGFLKTGLIIYIKRQKSLKKQQLTVNRPQMTYSRTWNQLNPIASTPCSTVNVCFPVSCTSLSWREICL